MRVVAAAATAVVAALAARVAARLLIRRAARPAGPGRGQQWLTQAGLDLTPVQFRLASAGGGLLAFVVLWVITTVWTVALPPALLVAVLPRVYFGRLRARRLAEVQQAWPDGLRDLVASISSGMSLGHAVEQLARSGPEPLRLAFARFGSLSRALGVVPALEVIREEMADPTSDRVIEVLLLAHERGGAIVPSILGDLAAATTRDAWTLEEIRSDSLEQRINARAVFLLPWLVLVAMTMQDGAFRDFYSSPSGVLVVAAGAVLSGVGMGLVGRLGAETEEPRVLTGGGWEGER